MDENLKYFLIWFGMFVLSIIFCVLSYFYSGPGTQVSLMSALCFGLSGLSSLVGWADYLENKR